MKYRIVPCVIDEIYYKIQIKGFFGWKDLPYDPYDVVFGHKNRIHKSVRSAKDAMLKDYGTDAEQVDFECA